jgi:hypothetical protein
MSDEPRTFTGGCHCGAVRFEARIDLSAGTGRCNCTYCAKAGFWGAMVKPDAFRLVSGEEHLVDYARNGFTHNPFCRTCGMRPFGHGDIPEVGGKFVTVNLNCLDDADLSGVPVKYWDGRHDAWHGGPIAVVPYVDPFAGVAAR